MKRWWWAPGALMVLGGCGEELPTSAGAGLLPADAIRTFEIVLEPQQYLVMDTAFGNFSDPRDADFVIIANEYAGSLNANALVGFNIPRTVNVRDTTGFIVTDVNPIFIGGNVMLRIDTARSSPAPVQLRLYRTAEAWEQGATWTLRNDTASPPLQWQQPGGTRGVLVDTATYVAGVDSVVFRVDSATVVAWADTLNDVRGALIVAETPDRRIRAELPILFAQARSLRSANPDTVAIAIAPATRHTFIFSPEQPSSAPAPRVGGTPGWRSILRLQDRLDTLSVACPGVANCRVRLSEVVINHAGLLLQPVPGLPGFEPEVAARVGAHLLLPVPQIPLQRSPLGELLGFSTEAIPPASFLAPGAPVAEVPVTQLIASAALSPARRGTAFVPTHVALVPVDMRTFGFATFAAMPRLRLVVSITRELQLP